MSTEPTPLILALAVGSVIVGGISIATQAPINATLNRTLADPLLAATISFFVGFVILLGCWFISLAVRGQGFVIPDLSPLPWWAWIGGALGTTYVLAALWSVPKIGVVTVVAAVVFGQLVASMVIDTFGLFGIEPQDISLTRVLAAAMVMGGMLLSKL